jgi:mediator of RNA polymerase II transcription subunit 17
VAYIPPETEKHSRLLFASDHTTRLRVALTSTKPGTEEPILSHSSRVDALDYDTLHEKLRSAQRALVEQEIFSTLVKEASQLATVSCEVDEDFISINVTHGLALKFEMVFTWSSLPSRLYSKPKPVILRWTTRSKICQLRSQRRHLTAHYAT